MESEVEGDIPPMQAAGIFSRMYIIWATPLIMRAAKEDDMNVDDLWPLRTQDTSQAAQEKLTKLWDQEIFAASRENRDPAFKRAVWNFVRRDIYQAFGFKSCFLLCFHFRFAAASESAPIPGSESPSEPVWVGLALALLLNMASSPAYIPLKTTQPNALSTIYRVCIYDRNI
jgi:hypothetical protein